MLKLLLTIIGIFYVKGQDFGYDGVFGPLHWGESYNSCDGKKQSPINIDPSHVTKWSFPALNFNKFDITPNNSELKNNGHTVVVTMDFEDIPTVSGGPLNGTYKFSQFHFHWGDNDTLGSEDKINNKSFPVELHMVFYHSKYASLNEALHHNNGLTVLAFFYNVSDENNLKYDELTSLLNTITEPSQLTSFNMPPTMFDLMSSDLDKYYTYFGSLTTPPCSEVVTWIDFSVPIPISPSQIQDFRLLNGHYGPITHNFRPIQALNERIVYENIPISQSQLDDKPPISSIDTNNIDRVDEEDEVTVPGAIGDVEPISNEYIRNNSGSNQIIENVFLVVIASTLIRLISFY